MALANSRCSVPGMLPLIATLLVAYPAHADFDAALRDSIMGMDFTRERVDVAALRRLDPSDLPLVRGIVFGRHGRIFRNDVIQVWLEQNSWYHPDSTFRNAVLSATERTNLDLIRQVEAETHEAIQPGDLRWWQHRRMTVEALGRHTRTEWAVLRAEVEAVHGRQFAGERWLQRYFEDRYWYRADPGYDARRLNDVERRNLALIDSLARAGAGGALKPCEMEPYELQELPVELLRGSSFAALRILRNEIYARHEMSFRSPAVAMSFAGRPWYVPHDSVVVKLSPIEQRNVATIARYERVLRDSLAIAPVDTTRLADLLPEDVRRLRLELYARHGRVFRKRWEQQYVAGLPGYRPDPSYTGARLTRIERANIAALARFEKTAAAAMDAVEG